MKYLYTIIVPALLVTASVLLIRDTISAPRTYAVSHKMHNDEFTDGGGRVFREGWAVAVVLPDGDLFMVKCSKEVWESVNVGDTVPLIDIQTTNGTADKRICGDNPD